MRKSFEKVYEEYRKAPEVTRERLYLDAVQDVMSRTNKVMVDVEGGNNIMYLPLDRLMQQSAVSGTPLNQESLRDLADAIARQNTDRTPSGRQPR